MQASNRDGVDDSEDVRRRLEALIRDFRVALESGELRTKVLALVPLHWQLRQLGKSLIPREMAGSARERVLLYFRQYPLTIISGQELLVVSGIQEWPRRLRELRVEYGWPIVSGTTARQMQDEFPELDLSRMGREDYILLSTEQDRDSAHRWNVANDIRRRRLSVRDKILVFFRENVGKPVTGEELRYLAGERMEWPRRVRELRTEHGWPIATKNKGRPDLPVGVYVLEADRQSPKHDRRIPDALRSEVLRRDGYRCKRCGWGHQEWNASDPRHLELHHVVHHVAGGPQAQENLVTLCTVCHDLVHRKEHVSESRG